MKICQICAVDFTIHHLLRPLFFRLRDSGHEVVGICADDPMLAPIRAEGFRIECIPAVRRLSPVVHIRAFVAFVRIFRRECLDFVHVHTPIVSLAARFAAAVAAALQDLVLNPELRREMGRAGLARAHALFDESKVLDRQLEVLFGQGAEK